MAMHQPIDRAGRWMSRVAGRWGLPQHCSHAVMVGSSPPRVQKLSDDNKSEPDIAQIEGQLLLDIAVIG